MFRPEATLNRRALRREAIQLAVVACACIAGIAAGSGVLHVVAGVVAAIALLLTGIASVVAWRVGGRGSSLVLYLGAAVLFLVLAVAAFARG